MEERARKSELRILNTNITCQPTEAPTLTQLHSDPARRSIPALFGYHPQRALSLNSFSLPSDLRQTIQTSDRPRARLEVHWHKGSPTHRLRPLGCSEKASFHVTGRGVIGMRMGKSVQETRSQSMPVFGNVITKLCLKLRD